MASGYNVLNRGDLDVLFAARTGAARSNVGYAVAGADLAQRYEQRSAAAIANVGYASAGVDLAQLFQGSGAGSTVQLLVGDYTRRDGANTAQITWSNSGAFTIDSANTTGTPYTWLLGGAASAYELFVGIQSGSFTTGTVATWLNLGAPQTFTRGAAPGTVQTVIFNVSIRNASTLAVLANAIGCSMTCDRR